MKFRWSTPPARCAIAETLADEFHLSPILAQCLVNRGWSTSAEVASFLEPRLKNLADPFLLPNMDAAVTRLLQAHDKKEPLVIFGDYDVDGVTSTALLSEFLTALGWTVNSFLPRRLEDGYGLSQDAVENCLRQCPAQLLLAVDCGSTSTATISSLQQAGIDVIVLDHHQVSDPPPPAVALVNPQLASVGAPDFRELCSVGLAFKLAHALLKRARTLNWPGAAEMDLRRFLDLVALGTVADLVPLRRENRILVSAGLPALSATTRPGLRALKEVAQCGPVIGAYEVGFQLGPRLNAAGRLEDAQEALKLLQSASLPEAQKLAASLDRRNRDRQTIERAIAEEAIAAIAARFNPATDFALVEGRSHWHIGVVGIVASRVTQTFHRPAIIVGGDSVEWRGSGRSIEGFDLAAALRECSDLLLRHGGHAMAAGLTVAQENLNLFRTRLSEIARRQLTAEQLQPGLKIDVEVSLSDLTDEFVHSLERLQPTGMGNPQPHFVLRGISHHRSPQRMGQEKQHAKFWITDGKKILPVVWWNCGPVAELPKVLFDLVFTPQINDYNGQRTVQLKLLDWKSAAANPSA